MLRDEIAVEFSIRASGFGCRINNCACNFLIWDFVYADVLREFLRMRTFGASGNLLWRIASISDAALCRIVKHLWGVGIYIIYCVNSCRCSQPREIVRWSMKRASFAHFWKILRDCFLTSGLQILMAFNLAKFSHFLLRLFLQPGAIAYHKSNFAFFGKYILLFTLSGISTDRPSVQINHRFLNTICEKLCCDEFWNERPSSVHRLAEPCF